MIGSLFSRLPIYAKITAAVMTTTVIVLMASYAGFVILETQAFRSELLADRRGFAEVTASNIGAALTFDDKEAVERNLRSLTGVSDIEAAYVLDEDGKVYSRFASPTLPLDVEREPVAIPIDRALGAPLRDAFAIQTPVIANDEAIGALQVRVSSERLNERIERYRNLAGIVLLFALTVSWILARIVAGLVAVPVARLNGAIEQVRGQRDYGSRVYTRSEDELGKLSDNFNLMLSEIAQRDALLEETVKERTEQLYLSTEKAKAASRAKSEFLANMSHEIRTPMNGVLGMTELLLQTEMNPRQRDLAKVIMSSGSNLVNIINDILDFSKIEAGRLELASEPFNLRETVDSVVSLLTAQVEEKGLELVVRYQPGLPEVFEGDEGRIRQVLTNLVGNAVKFTETGYVRINVEGLVRGGKAKLDFAVTDTGIGISRDKLSRIFEKFEQADGSASRRYEGTGLGLSISKSIVELAGGRLSASSTEGAGSTFSFDLRLPVVRSEPDVSMAAGALENVRVLVIEGKEQTREVLDELFSSWGATVELASSGSQAYQMLGKAQPDLIVCDSDLPDMSWREMDATIRRESWLASTPVVVLAKSSEATKAAASDSGRTSVVAKPYRIEPLVRAVSGALVAGGAEQTRAAADAGRVESAADRPEPAEKPTVKEGEDVPQIRVLVADDNKVNRLVMTKMIEGLGFLVDVAENGKRAVELFMEKRPDLVVMDVSMPEMDGLEATAAIRAFERENTFGRVPIIAATAHALEEDKRRCHEAGMDDYIAKPVKQAALAQKLRTWIGEVEAA